MAKGPETKTPLDAVEILRRRYDTGPESEILLCEERANAEIAQLIYDARTGASLTQEELAARIGSTKSVISRLEDADYEGHSLGMLRRIAEALGLKVSLRFEPAAARAAKPAVKVVRRGRMERMSFGEGSMVKRYKAPQSVKEEFGGKAARKGIAKKG